MKRIRLIKVVIQPVFILDDGETLTELAHGSIEIPASEWPDYHDRFSREVDAWEQQLNTDD